MLIDVETYLKENNVDNMSLKELIAFKQEQCDHIKYLEDNKYTDKIVELASMHPEPSVHYAWHCKCLFEICLTVVLHEDCDKQLREECKNCIIESRKKLREGLYGEDDLLLFQRRFEISRRRRRAMTENKDL